MNLKDVSAHWVALHEQLGLGSAIADEAHYERMLDVAGRLMDDPAVHEGPLGGLVALLADRIRDYEDRIHPWPDTVTPGGVLAALMQEHGLTQSQLPELGSQGVVSEVLSGKRELNLRQVKALAARFSVPLDVFV